MVRHPGIYMIKNKINGKVYIGSAYNILNRWKKHLYSLTNSYQSNDILQKSWNKYGQENFEIMVIEELPKDDNILKKREDYWINFYDTMHPNGYNLASAERIILSKYSRNKISEANKRRYKERPESFAIKKETALKISLIHKERFKNNPELFKHSEETKRKMSISHKGKKLSEETKWKKRQIPLDTCIKIYGLCQLGERTKDIARKFKVSINTVSAIRQGKHWSNEYI